jgi:hypothetical protein
MRPASAFFSSRTSSRVKSASAAFHDALFRIIDLRQIHEVQLGQQCHNI